MKVLLLSLALCLALGARADETPAVVTGRVSSETRGAPLDLEVKTREGGAVQRKDASGVRIRDRISKLERFLNPNVSAEDLEVRLSEEDLLAEFKALRKVTKGTPAYREVIGLYKEYLARRNHDARFLEGRSSPTGTAGRLEAPALVK